MVTSLMSMSLSDVFISDSMMTLEKVVALLEQSETQQQFLECCGFDETTEPEAQEESTMPRKVVMETTDQCFNRGKRANPF